MQLAPGLPYHDSPPNRDQIMTIAQLALSGMGMVFSLLGAGLLFLYGLANVFSEAGKLQSTAQTFGLAWFSALIAVLLLPSVVFSYLRLAGKEIRLPRVSGLRLVSAMLLVWPLALAVGNLVSKQSSIAWLLLPPLQILAIGIPLWFLFEIARRNLSLGGRQRGWGLLSFSLLISTPVTIVAELMLIIVLVIALTIWLTGRADLIAEIQRLGEQMSKGPIDPQALIELVRPYLRNPLVIFGSLALMAGLIPMIEELFKSLAVWLLVGHKLSPTEGFVSGALCGAGFALIESLAMISGSVQESWAVRAVGQAGPGLLHITTTALMGWALARAWKEGAYLRLGVTYLLAVTLHGLWNGLVILTSLSVILENPPAELQFISALGKVGPIGLAVLTMVFLLLLWGSNQRLHREASAGSDTITSADGGVIMVVDAPDRSQTTPADGTETTKNPIS